MPSMYYTSTCSTTHQLARLQGRAPNHALDPANLDLLLREPFILLRLHLHNLLHDVCAGHKHAVRYLCHTSL